MTFDINYYFENISKDELFYKCIGNSKEILDIFTNTQKTIINEIEKSQKQIIKTNQIDDNVKIIGNVYIGENTKILSGAIIKGPVYIGDNCEISYNAYIRPGTVIGNDCVVEYSSQIKNSIMRDGSKVSALSFVGDSILGKNSRVGSGVITANRAFNQSNIIIKDENKNKINLLEEFLGVIEGDNSRIGSNVTTSPGTFIGAYSWIYPHTCIHGFVPREKKVYDKQQLIFLDNEKKELYKATDYNK